MSVHLWTPGMAGPLDEFVGRVIRMAEVFAETNGLEQAEVRVELVDGSHHVLASATPEPGFGFFSFMPHQAEGDEPSRVIVPIGAVKLIEISMPDPERRFGFSATE